MLPLLLASSVVPAAAVSLAPRWTADIKVDPSTTYQVVDGFGFSQAFGRAQDIFGLYGLPEANQTYVLDLLFDKDKGAGFTILRNDIGSSNTSSMLSIAPYAPVPDSPSTPLNYSFDHYDTAQFPLSQAGRQRGLPYIYADAWSAPGYMKTNGQQEDGGYVCGVTNGTCSTGSWIQAYADYLVQYWKFYNDAGVPITQLGVFNEPGFQAPYAGMLADGQQAAEVIRVVGETLKREGIPVELTCCDNFGWQLQEQLMAGLNAVDPSTGKSASDYIDIITGHGYQSPPNFQLSTNHRVWETEWADLTGEYHPYTFWANASQAEGSTWAGRIQTAFTQANVSAFLYWIGAENATASSSLINLINNEVVTSKRFWVFAQFSKFVRPGAHRIEASSSTSDLTVTAFKNTDGSLAVQVLNNATAPYSVSLDLNNDVEQALRSYITDNDNDLTQQADVVGVLSKFEITIPAKSLVSYVSLW